MAFRMQVLIMFVSLVLGPCCSPDRSNPASITDFGLTATGVYLYYRDLAAAETFYTVTLGLEVTADYGFAKTVRVAGGSYLFLVDAGRRKNAGTEPKTVAVALLTDQLEQWYHYLERQHIPMRYRLTADTGNPHDGFVAVDPEGYLLEFERFNPHPENSRLLPRLDTLPRIPVSPAPDMERPPGLSFHGMITWLYYRDMEEIRRFYETALGLPLAADQGWACIYHASGSGYVGLVDGKRGMHPWTGSKAVKIGFIMSDPGDWLAAVTQDTLIPLLNGSCIWDRDGRCDAFIGVDPGGYHLEFNRPFPHGESERLMTIRENKQ
ncbi:VOC family protein [bacterium]|nr:VOC family protein [bacterium]